MGNYTHKDISHIMDDFKEFISGLEKRTQDQYSIIIWEYLEYEVCDEVELNLYGEIFSQERICDYLNSYRNHGQVRAAIKKLKDLFVYQGKLDKSFYYEFPQIEKNNRTEQEMISVENIRNVVFGEETEFRNEPEKIVTQCICAICYFCLFDQKHLENLKCRDVLIDERRMKNLANVSQVFFKSFEKIFTSKNG